MDFSHKKLIELKEEILKLREKKASLQAIISTLQEEKQKYIQELNNLGVSFENINNEIEMRKNKLVELNNKIEKIKQVLNKFI